MIERKPGLAIDASDIVMHIQLVNQSEESSIEFLRYFGTWIHDTLQDCFVTDWAVNGGSASQKRVVENAVMRLLKLKRVSFTCDGNLRNHLIKTKKDLSNIHVIGNWEKDPSPATSISVDYESSIKEIIRKISGSSDDFYNTVATEVLNLEHKTYINYPKWSDIGISAMVYQDRWEKGCFICLGQFNISCYLLSADIDEFCLFLRDTLIHMENIFSNLSASITIGNRHIVECGMMADYFADFPGKYNENADTIPNQSRTWFEKSYIQEIGWFNIISKNIQQIHNVEVENFNNLNWRVYDLQDGKAIEYMHPIKKMCISHLHEVRKKILPLLRPGFSIRTLYSLRPRWELVPIDVDEVLCKDSNIAILRKIPRKNKHAEV